MSIDRKSNEYSNQEIIEKLRAIIDLEESKPLAERDVDLITECVDYLMELEQGVELTQEELEEEKQKIYAYNKNLNKPAKRFKFKGLLVAACFVILMLLANFVAIACGVDTIAMLKNLGYSIVEMIVGEQKDIDGNSIVKVEKSLSYNSIEDFLQTETDAILYPTKMPDGIDIDSIKIRNSMEDFSTYNVDYKDYFFVATDSNYSFIVRTSPNAQKQFLTNSNLDHEIINSYDCYIFQDTTYVQCNFIHENIVYEISVPTYESLITIINNLKEK